MKIVVSWFAFHWTPIQSIQLIISITGSDNGSAPNIRQVASEQKRAYVTDSYMRHSAAMSYEGRRNKMQRII